MVSIDKLVKRYEVNVLNHHSSSSSSVTIIATFCKTLVNQIELEQ